jgi:hypothetical protein
MGLRPTAPIVAIGAATFDYRKMIIGERWYANVSLASSVALGSVIDPDTVMWWLRQSDDARKALTRPAMYANEALAELSAWMDRNMVERKQRRVWCAGPDFDFVLLREHYIKAGLEVPWEFYNQRDYRTIREELGINVEQDPRVGHHNALDDALHQINHLFKIRKALRNGN